MTYSPPTGTAVNFSWAGQPEYVPPGGSAVVFNFAAVSGGSVLRVWGGESWRLAPIYIWDGGEWAGAQLQVWDGADWQSA
jgi:hypothetical protein